MNIPESLHCLFTGQIDHRDGSYVIEIPEQELDRGTLEHGESYRIALMPATAQTTDETSQPEPAESEEPHAPPVDAGDTRVVEIESLGEQGDGIARVDRGFVVIVPDTEPNERVRVEITDVHETVAFATVTERLEYYA